MVVGAKHPRQRELAAALGADHVVPPDQLPRAVRRHAGSLVLVGGQLTGGADVVFDCVGSAASITESLALVRPRGRVVLVGMPGQVSVDLAPLWHRESPWSAPTPTAPRRRPGRTAPERRSFELAIDLVGAGLARTAGLGPLSPRALRGGLAHAGAAGRRGAVKVAFDLRNPKGRSR